MGSAMTQCCRADGFAPALLRRGRQSDRDGGIRAESRAVELRAGAAVDPGRLPLLRLRPGVSAVPGSRGHVPALRPFVRPVE